MKIKPWVSPSDQMCKLGRNHWSVARLFELSRDLPVIEAPLDLLCVYYTYERITLREMVMHMKAVQDADLTAPILLDEDGELMDGRHRIMKAMLTGAETIKVKRFDENPLPDKVEE